MHRTKRFAPYLAAAALLLAAAIPAWGEPIAIEPPQRTTPVDFQSEILPILRANCLACHNASEAEGSLNLETPATIRSGGDQGPAVSVDDPEASLLLLVASHRQESFMPPPENKVGARALAPRELGLLKLWIAEGAAGEVAPPRKVEFQPLPSSVQPIFAVAVTPDGRYAAASRAGGLDLYHLPTRRSLGRLVDRQAGLEQAHADVIRSLAFDPTGRYLASGSYRQVKLWRLPHVDRLAEWSGPESITAAALSADGALAAVGDAQGRIRICTVPGGDERHAFDAHSGAVTALAFSADGARLISASGDKSIAWSSVAEGKIEQTLVTPAAVLAALRLGESLVTAHDDQLIRIWPAGGPPESGEPLRAIEGHSQPITALAAADNSDSQFLTGSADGMVRRFDAETGESLRSWNHGQAIASVAAAADGTRVAAAGGSSVKLWNADDGELIAEIKGDPAAADAVIRLEAEIAFRESAIRLAKNDIKSYEGSERRVKTTAEAVKKAEDEELAKAEKTLGEKQEALAKLTAGENADEKKLAQAQKELAEAETARDVALTIVERAKVVAQRAVDDFAAAEKAVADDEALLKELQADKEAAEKVAADSEHDALSVAFSSDSRRLVIGSSDGRLHAYDASSGAPLEAIARHEQAVAVLSAADDGRLLSAGRDGTLRVDQLVTEWSLERTLGSVDDPATLADRAAALAFSPDGELLAVGGGLASRSGELKLFHTADGRFERELSPAGADVILALDFSADGTRLAAGGCDRVIRLFDLESGQLQQTLAGHTAHVTGVSFNGQGNLLVSSGTDMVLKLWDAETGRPIHTMKGSTYRIGPYRREVTAAAFIGDSEQILAASGDGTVRLHRASSESDILTFADSTGYLYAAAASDDGRAIVAGGSDGVLWLYTGQNRSPQATFPPEASAGP